MARESHHTAALAKINVGNYNVRKSSIAIVVPHRSLYNAQCRTTQRQKTKERKTASVRVIRSLCVMCISKGDVMQMYNVYEQFTYDN